MCETSIEFYGLSLEARATRHGGFHWSWALPSLQLCYGEGRSAWVTYIYGLEHSITVFDHHRSWCFGPRSPIGREPMREPRDVDDDEENAAAIKHHCAPAEEVSESCKTIFLERLNR